MAPFSAEFKLILFVIWTLCAVAGGFYVEHLRWVDAEAGRPVAVARIKETIRVRDVKEVKRYEAKAAELDQLNIDLEKELAYARTQIHGTATFGDSFISVWDAKLEGRPVGMPSAAGGVSAKALAARDAEADDLLANEAANAVSCAVDRQKLEGLREWACRVHKICPA